MHRVLCTSGYRVQGISVQRVLCTVPCRGSSAHPGTGWVDLAILSLLVRFPRTPPELPFRRDSNPGWTICCGSGPNGPLSASSPGAPEPSRTAFWTGFQPSLDDFLWIWPRWSFSASWPGAPELSPNPIQNGLSDGISAQFGQFAVDLVLVTIFSLLARYPRTLP